MDFKSTQFRASCDNPSDPSMLERAPSCNEWTVDQKERTVCYFGYNCADFTIRNVAPCAGVVKAGISYSPVHLIAYSCAEVLKPGLCVTFAVPHVVTLHVRTLCSRGIGLFGFFAAKMRGFRLCPGTVMANSRVLP